MPQAGLKIGILADDLTGATDTALMFFKQRCPAQVLLCPAQPSASLASGAAFNPLKKGNHLWSLNTDSRHCSPAEAAQRLGDWARWLKNTLHVDYVYKKMDSTCRGNVAIECLATMEALGLEGALIVPAYPAEHRQTVGGYQLLRGLPIEKTEVGRDPMAPVRQSYLPTLLKKQLAPEQASLVGLIPLSVVLRGAGPLVAAMNEAMDAGQKLIVVDATSEDDLNQVVLAYQSLSKTRQVLPCGSAGLAKALSKAWLGQTERSATYSDDWPQTLPALPALSGPILLVSGSIMPTTRRQLKQVLNHPTLGQQAHLVSLKPAQLLQTEASHPQETLLLSQSIAQGLETKGLSVVCSALAEDSFEQALKLAESVELSAESLPKVVQNRLSTLCATVLSQQQSPPKHKADPAILVLCGGDTATHLCQQLGIETLTLQTEVTENVALCQYQTQQGETGWLLSKSGNFGDPLTLVTLLTFINDLRPVASAH